VFSKAGVENPYLGAILSTVGSLAEPFPAIGGIGATVKGPKPKAEIINLAKEIADRGGPKPVDKIAQAQGRLGKIIGMAEDKLPIAKAARDEQLWRQTQQELWEILSKTHDPKDIEYARQWMLDASGLDKYRTMHAGEIVAHMNSYGGGMEKFLIRHKRMADPTPAPPKADVLPIPENTKPSQSRVAEIVGDGKSDLPEIHYGHQRQSQWGQAQTAHLAKQEARANAFTDEQNQSLKSYLKYFGGVDNADSLTKTEILDLFELKSGQTADQYFKNAKIPGRNDKPADVIKYPPKKDGDD
jgi:hypothetical protein